MVQNEQPQERPGASGEPPTVPVPVVAELGEQVQELAQPAPALQAGDRVSWGELDVVVVSPMRDGWFRARADDGAVVDIRPALPPHAGTLAAQPIACRLLRYLGEEGIALEQREAVSANSLKPLDAVRIALTLAELVGELASEGLAVVDLDPAGLVWDDAAGAVALARWPIAVTIGEPLPARHRDGISPPELAAGGAASGNEGVYLVAAMLALFLRGEPLGPEGLVGAIGPMTGIPGVPQLLTRCLAPAAERPGPAALVELLAAVVAPAQPRLAFGAATTVGCNPDRKDNQDSYGIAVHWADGAVSRQVTRVALADGMGGMDGGDVASRAAITAVLAAEPPASLEGERLADWAVAVGWLANAAVLESLRGRNGGTTFTAIVLDGARYAMVHVGDSRAYLAVPREDRLEQLSRDHSLAAALVASGQVEHQQAARSPDRNRLLRSLGGVPGPTPEYFAELGTANGERTSVLEPGAALLLVCDGVWDVVDEAALRNSAAIALNGDPQGAASALIDLAIAGGAPDNASAVVVTRIR